MLPRHIKGCGSAVDSSPEMLLLWALRDLLGLTGIETGPGTHARMREVQGAGSKGAAHVAESGRAREASNTAWTSSRAATP